MAVLIHICSTLLKLFLFGSSVVFVLGGKWDSSFVQKSEAEHWGGGGRHWTHPPVVDEFRAFVKGTEHEALVDQNDMDIHHRIAAAFCKQREQPCLWQEYHAVFDALREPFAALYDPAPGHAFSLDQLRERGQAKLRDCTRFSGLPTAQDFLTLMQLSAPVVFSGAEHWPALQKWTYEYLVEKIGWKKVVASVSPHGYFDAAEDSVHWIKQSRKSKAQKAKAKRTGEFNATEEVVIARPGHVSFDFKTFVEQLHKANIDDHPSLYLEYFPLYALATNHMDRGCVSSSNAEECKAEAEEAEEEGKNSASILEDIENLDFANFLFPRQRLFWMGAGKTVGALHFDRNENLMAVIRGKKKFVLFPPNASASLHADTKLRSASYGAHYDENERRIHVWRDLKTLRKTAVISVYSPVNLSSYDTNDYPRMEGVKPQVCEVGEGEIIYVPAQWWHEVESVPDDEGKTIGINFFYEPLWQHHQFNSTSKIGVMNRYYNYVLNNEHGVAKPCTDETVCFK